MKYNVTVPIVGYSTVFVEAKDEKEAIEKAFDICCDFDKENVELGELYGEEHVIQGNVCSHPFWDVEVEESI